MSDSKQGNVISVRGSSVRYESECNLDSGSFGRQALTCCVTVDTRHQRRCAHVYNNCNKTRTKTTATGSIVHRHRHARAHRQIIEGGRVV